MRLWPCSLDRPGFFASPSQRQTSSVCLRSVPESPARHRADPVCPAQGPAAMVQTSSDLGSGLCADSSNTCVLAFLSTPCLQGGEAAGLGDTCVSMCETQLFRPHGWSGWLVGTCLAVWSAQTSFLFLSPRTAGAEPRDKGPVSGVFSPSAPGDALTTGEGSPWPQSSPLLPPRQHSHPSGCDSAMLVHVRPTHCT